MLPYREWLVESKVEDEIKAHPHTEDISDERSSGDGYWVYLKKGYQMEPSSMTHSVHEDTPSKALAALKKIVPCDCEYCKQPD